MVNVLIVDDNKYMRYLIRSMLENKGHKVVGEAKDKEEAIKFFKELKPDVIIMDLRMPEKGDVAEVALSGISATEEIKKMSSKVKIIVCTAAVQEKYKDFVIKAGADGYITKPYKEHELIKAIEE